MEALNPTRPVAFYSAILTRQLEIIEGMLI